MSRKSGSGLELSESLRFWGRTWFSRGGFRLGLCFPACLPYPSLMAPSIILRVLECLTVETLAHTSKSSFPLFSVLQMATPQPVLRPRACTLVTWSGLCMEWTWKEAQGREATSELGDFWAGNLGSWIIRYNLEGECGLHWECSFNSKFKDFLST